MLAVCMGVKMVFVLFGKAPTDGWRKWGNNLKIEIRGKLNENIQQYPKG